MNLNDKKTAKQLIKLACSIGVASKIDLMILYDMTLIKLQDLGIVNNFGVHDKELVELLSSIRDNPHLMALMRVKNKD